MSVSCNLSHKGLERLKKALSDKRMSKQELADKAKVARSTVSNLFLGRSVLSEKLSLMFLLKKLLATTKLLMMSILN